MKIKRIIALIIATLMMMSCISVCYAAETEKNPLGDVNYDGKYNLSDVAIILKYMAKWDLGDLDDRDDFISRCDVNLDGKVNLHDASYYLRWYADTEIQYYVPTKEEHAYWAYCNDLREQGLPAPSMDEWLISLGYDIEKYHEWLDDRYNKNMISYEDWLVRYGK